MSDQHFEPGPVEYTQELDESTQDIHALIQRLTELAKVSGSDIREYEVPFGGQTDATGFLKMYIEIPQGFAFHVHRINVNAINPATGLPYTPAAPFTAGWFGFFRGEVGLMSMFDFAPPSPGANVFPQISSDGNKQSVAIRGERICFQVTAGPVSSQVGGVVLGRLEAFPS